MDFGKILNVSLLYLNKYGIVLTNINLLVLSVSVLTTETELLVLLFFFAALFIFSSPVPGGPSAATAQTIRPD